MMILLTLISLFFIPVAKSGASMAVCPACAAACIIPFSPFCIACVLANCVAAPILTAWNKRGINLWIERKWYSIGKQWA